MKNVTPLTVNRQPTDKVTSDTMVPKITYTNVNPITNPTEFNKNPLSRSLFSYIFPPKYEKYIGRSGSTHGETNAKNPSKKTKTYFT